VAEHRELALSVEAGLTPMQALTLATSNAAGLLKLDDRGVLAAGKLANSAVRRWRGRLLLARNSGRCL